MPHMTASNFPDQRLALGRVRYRQHARICALPDHRLLGRTVRLLYSRHGRRLHMTLLDADVCGTRGRCDLPQGTFADLYGRGWRRAGVFPVVVKIGQPSLEYYGPKKHHQKKARRSHTHHAH